MKSSEYVESKYVDLFRLTNYDKFYKRFWEGQVALLAKRDALPREFLEHIEAPQWMYYTVLHRLASAHSYIQRIASLEALLGTNRTDAKITFDCTRAYEACFNEFYGAINSLEQLIRQLCCFHAYRDGKVYSEINKIAEDFIGVFEKLQRSIPDPELGIRHKGVHTSKPFIHLDSASGRFMQLKKYLPGLVYEDYTKAIVDAKTNANDKVEEVVSSLLVRLDKIVNGYNKILEIIHDELLPIYFKKMKGLVDSF